MTPHTRGPGLPRSRTSTWFVFALSGVFVLLGILFILAPRTGAALFGLPAPEGRALGYLPAIGLRDLAFGLYLYALNRTAPPRALGLVLAITVLIPVGDIAILALERGAESPGHLLLHGLSGLAMMLASAWVLLQGQRHEREERP
jgi:hypothetical protein